MLNTAKRLSRFIARMNAIPDRLEELKQAVGNIAARQVAQIDSADLHLSEFKIYSQSGEDGVIQFLISRVDIPNKVFIEFGVDTYLESNTRFLLTNNNWAGLIMDGSPAKIAAVKRDPIYWKHNLKAESAFIDRDNINDLIRASGISGDIGLLSIDIDGNDYWVWEVINDIRPRIVVLEYNSLFGPTRRVSVPYDPTFSMMKAHYSGLYFGASIGALDYLARKKGYSLAGSTSSGLNVFFVREDVAHSVPTYTPEQAYVKTQFRTSRDPEGGLTYLDFEDGVKLIAHLPLEEVDTHSLVCVA